MTPARIFIAVAALAAAPVASAQTVAPPAAARIAPARLALGLELARLLNSEAGTIAMLEKMLGESLPRAILADPNVAAMERQYPGIVADMIAAMKPLMITYMRGELPSLWEPLAALYATHLSEADLHEVIAFYSSPTGARIIAFMEQSVDYEPMLREMAASGDYALSDAAMDNAEAASVEQLPGQLSPGEMAAVVRFTNTPAGRRFVALLEQSKAIVSQWAAEPTPELDARLEAAVMAVINKRIGR